MDEDGKKLLWKILQIFSRWLGLKKPTMESING